MPAPGTIVDEMESDQTSAAVPAVTPEMLETLRAKRVFLVDLDGVVYTGSTPIPGAKEFFAFLDESGRRFQCITNNSTLSAQQYVQKLAEMDIRVTEAQVLTSSQATAVALHARLPRGARVLAIGEEGLTRALLDGGYRLVHERPDVVVLGLDRRLTYQRLKAACLAARAGVPVVATNPDHSLPTEEGMLPGNGATIAYIQAATGVTPAVIGKPEATMLEVAMELLGANKEETAIIGDGLLTDMLAGQRAAVTKVLVLTGVATLADIPTAPAPPDYVFTDLPALQAALAD